MTALALDLFYVGGTKIGVADWLAWTVLALLVLAAVSLAVLE